MLGRRASVLLLTFPAGGCDRNGQVWLDIIGPISLFSPIFPESFLTLSLLICPRGGKVRPVERGTLAQIPTNRGQGLSPPRDHSFRRMAKGHHRLGTGAN